MVLSWYLSHSGSSPLYSITGLIASAAFLLYIPMRRCLSRTPDPPTDTKRTRLILDGAWLLVLAGALTTYLLRPEPYERPLIFYAAMAILSGLLAAKILLCDLRKTDVILSLVQAVVIGLCLEWTVTLMYPSLVGLDPWWHQYQTQRILNGVDIGLGAIPVMYYFVAGVMWLTGLPYRLAAMSVSFVQVAGDALLVFLICRHVWNSRTGLLAALVVSISGWHIYFGYWTIPNTLGLTLVLALVYFALAYTRSRSVYWIPAMLATIGLLVFTHTIATVWGVALLSLAVLLSGRSSRAALFAVLCLLVIVVGIAWWYLGFADTLKMMIHYRFSPEVLEFTTLPGLTSIIPPVPIPPEIVPILAAPVPSAPIMGGYVETLTGTSMYETLFNASGMVAVFAITIIGSLWMLARRNVSRWTLFVVLSIAFFLSIGVFPALFGVSFLEYRWWYAAQVLAAIPIAILGVSLSSRRLRIGFAAVVAVLCFLMTIGLPANMDNNTFSKNQLVRYAMTQGEIDAVRDVMSQQSGTVGMDAYYTLSSHLMPQYRSRMLNATPNFLSGDFSPADFDVVMVRYAVAYGPFGSGESVIYRLTYDPNRTLTEAGYEKIYDQGGVKAYRLTGQTK